MHTQTHVDTHASTVHMQTHTFKAPSLIDMVDLTTSYAGIPSPLVVTGTDPTALLRSAQAHTP